MKPAATEIAIWALTPGGARLGQKLADALGNADLLVLSRVASSSRHIAFERLSNALARNFTRYQGHIFIMATGIVVRQISGLLDSKTRDPAVVVMDETGRWAISLVSGHLGGANELAHLAARLTGARPVITTATDCLELPAIDSLAAQKGLKIANPEAIKAVSMALIEGESPLLWDPDNWLGPRPAGFDQLPTLEGIKNPSRPAVVVSDTVIETGGNCLVLNPPSLAVGIGCRKKTDIRDLRRALFDVFQQYGLAPASIFALATAAIKKDEESIHLLAGELNSELVFYQAGELKTVEDRTTPSDLVEKHVGVKSVCEAAAILTVGKGRLIVPKQKTSRVTVAVARRTST